jgi:hypothetical protein
MTIAFGFARTLVAMRLEVATAINESLNHGIYLRSTR